MTLHDRVFKPSGHFPVLTLEGLREWIIRFRSFFVHPKTDKPQIKKAVEEMFGVKVLRVNTMYRKGKKKRFGYVIGQQSTRKIAIVTLAEGDTIEAFGV